MLINVFKAKSNEKSLVKKKKFFIFNKSQVILKFFLGYTINIYKGNLYRKLLINKYLVGFKYGCFSHTRKPNTYVLKKKSTNSFKR